MMLKRTCAIVFLLGILGLLAACGAGSGTSLSSSSTTTTTGTDANLTITDAPPAGVAVVSFEVTINNVTLQPGDVPLINKPQRVELTSLQAHTAFLDSKKVPPGTYTGMTVTYASPSLTITNNTGAAIGTCAINATCELHPPVGTGQFSFTSAPFPITVGQGSPFGLLVAFDLKNTIQNDLSLAPVITVKQVTSAAGHGPDQDIDDVTGKVTAKDTTANTITIQSGGSDGKTTTITVDANTVYKHFDDAQLTNTFASVAVGQALKADLKLQAGGVLLAKVIELRGATTEQHGQLAGMITSVDSATQFKMVVRDETPDITSADHGTVVTVTLSNPKPFTKDDLNLTIPQGVQFSTSADLMVGQLVLVKPTASMTAAAITTSDVRLLTSSITARVSAINGANITVDTLPAIFTSANPSVTSMTVSTSNLTAFENVSGVSGLAVGDQISFDGLLFKASPPVVAARKVRKRN